LVLLLVIPQLWSIIDDAGVVVSSLVPSAVTLLSFHTSTGKLGSRPIVFTLKHYWMMVDYEPFELYTIA
jgi:hypothetical protein